MSFFNRIGKIFSQQEKEIGIEDAIKIIEEQRNEKSDLITEESYNNANKIYSECY